MDLANVVWIGGGQGSGKSTVARELSRRFGLRLYNVDHRTYDHLRRGAETAIHGRSPDEKWLVPTVDELVARMEHSWAERFALVLEDLAAGPDEAVVVDGPQLLPGLVAEVAAPCRALFLAAAEDEQRAALEARGTGPYYHTSDPERAMAVRIERDLAFARRVAGEARALGLPVLVRAGTVDETVARAVALLDLPAPLSAGALERARREEEAALERQIALYRASGDAPPEDDDERKR